jgi:hypothetical protein
LYSAIAKKLGNETSDGNGCEWNWKGAAKGERQKKRSKRDDRTHRAQDATTAQDGIWNILITLIA